jgi:hypothetical protein
MGKSVSDISNSWYLCLLLYADAAEGLDSTSLEAHSSKLASQLSHLSSLLDRKGAINMQAYGASSFVPLMKVMQAEEVFRPASRNCHTHVYAYAYN